MTATARLRSVYLLHLSKPATDRLIYRTIYGENLRRILEIGIREGQRALRMIEVGRMCAITEPIHYTGVDEFESRRSEVPAGLTLKAAHRAFHATGASVRLLPGDPLTALSRAANTLGKVDLVVVSAHVEQEAMARAWLFVSRLLCAESFVFVEELESPGGRIGLRRLSDDEIARRAETYWNWRAA